MIYKKNVEKFSVYNLPSEKSQSHALAFLDGDPNTGWHVARNLLKPLNHLEFLKEKEEIARKLNLHNLATSKELFDSNYQLLESHQQKKIATGQVISILSEQTKRIGQLLTSQEIRQMLHSYATIRHMEFHPSDVCNLTCMDCTYGHDEEETKPLPINFSFGSLQKIAQLKPRSMVVIGGGEPTLYVHNKRRFQEMNEEILQNMPKISLALVTNGTFIPKGDWPNHYAWIRLSLDAASTETYRNFRGKDFFDKTIKNYLRYLDFDVPHIGISFLFARSNIHEYAQVASFIYELVKKEKPQHLHKVNIQYRPLRRDPYEYHKEFTEAVSQEQINRAVEEVIHLAKSSKKMKAFLRDQTNISAILGGNSHPPLDFKRCYYNETFKIIRANGDIRPCFIRVTEPDFIAGNIHRDSLESIALNTLYIAAKRKPHCDAHGCRQCHVNYTFEKGLSGELRPSTSLEVQADPMY